MAGTHDLFVNLIGKAISTGSRACHPGGPRAESFMAGRVSAFVYSAAMQADMQYGAEFEQIRHTLMREVLEIRKSWARDELQDAALVGAEATTIANKLLAA